MKYYIFKSFKIIHYVMLNYAKHTFLCEIGFETMEEHKIEIGGYLKTIRIIYLPLREEAITCGRKEAFLRKGKNKPI